MRSNFTSIVQLLFVIFIVMLCGCTKKVFVPPHVELSPLGHIGIVTFTTNSKGNLADLATQRFIETIQRAQPRIMILELGSVQSHQSPEDIRNLKHKHNLDAVFTGDLNVSGIKPEVNLSKIVSSMQVGARVEATLAIRLRNTETGATVWSRTSSHEESVAKVGYRKGGQFTFDAKDPQKAYGNLINTLVRRIGVDFFSGYVRQRKRR